MKSKFIVLHMDENLDEYSLFKSAEEDAMERGNPEDYVIYEVVATYTAKHTKIKWKKETYE